MKKKDEEKPKEEYFCELLEEGEFYFLNNNYDEAQKLLEKALAIKLDARVLYTLGLIFEMKNEKDKAQEMYRRALELNPDLKEAKNHLEKILKGWAYLIPNGTDNKAKEEDLFFSLFLCLISAVSILC